MFMIVNLFSLIKHDCNNNLLPDIGTEEPLISNANNYNPELSNKLVPESHTLQQYFNMNIFDVLYRGVFLKCRIEDQFNCKKKNKSILMNNITQSNYAKEYILDSGVVRYYVSVCEYTCGTIYFYANYLTHYSIKLVKLLACSL